MDPKQIFINSAGRLRSGWRLLVFVLIFVSLLFILGTVARIVYAIAAQMVPGESLGNFLENIVYRTILLAAALFAGLACNRLLEGLPWRALGLAFHTHWLRDFIVGSIIGVGSLALATAIATAGGGLRFSVSSREMLFQVVQTLVLSAVLFVVAALAEEALFRGYPLQTMTRAGLFGFGALLTSLAFTAVHIQNPNFKQGIPFINLFIAGVWFAVAYWRTRSLWFPLGIHWSWNWALGSLFGLPVSGITEIAPNPLLRGTDLGPAWLTGGSYGIEGGIACTITLVISTVLVWRFRLVDATEEMKQLSSQENSVGNSAVSGREVSTTSR
jgi:membrane protease YdiL (CAAX protease family)